MSGPSVLNNIDPVVLNPLCRENHDSVSVTVGMENSAEALGLLYQTSEITHVCEKMFKDISNRLYNINQRIRTAEKSIETFEKNTVIRQEELYTNDVKKNIEQIAEKLGVDPVSKFDFFALPKTNAKKAPSKPIPAISKLIPDSVTADIVDEFTSSRKKESMEVHLRVDEPKLTSPSKQSISIYSTITKKYILNHNHRMTTTLKEKLAFGCSDDSMDTNSPIPPTTLKSTIPKRTVPAGVSSKVSTDTVNVLPKGVMKSSSAESEKGVSKSSTESTLPKPTPSESTKTSTKPPPPPADALKPSTQTIKPPPPPTDILRVTAKPPPPSSQPPPSSTSTSSDYRPPANFLAEIRQKGSERQEGKVTEPTPKTTPPKLPANFLAEIRQKGGERQATKPAEPPSEHLLDEIRQKGGERQAMKPAESSEVPKPVPRPTNFLAEIRQKGGERQAAVMKRAQEVRPPMEGTSRQSTLSSRGGTIRMGTLGGDTRASCRYGTGILNDIRGLERDSFFAQSEEEAVPQKPKPSGNPFLNEIRNFDMKKLRKVNIEEVPSTTATSKRSEPTVADMLRERLRIMQSDSSDDSDSSSDFSD